MTEPTVVCHPLIAHSLTVLRDRETQTPTFRQHAAIVSKIVLVEATRLLAVKEHVINTPLATMTGSRLRDRIVAVPVLRAGLAMLFAAQDLLLDVPVGFIGLERDEHTAVPRSYYEKIPRLEVDHQVLVLDPMLATGGSLDDSLNRLKDRGAGPLTLACLVAAPEGIERVLDRHPDARIVTAAIDEKLDENKFIVPGLGDFGDRYFGTEE
ncbi:MAG: uracil phosphoribosyltransferase [Verrucomicrobia bacterium]|jgi:uracil phosphoribosyltransferase|nr:uracil phosphoribosyltransferase [Verrucomicrobiota bacterium]MBT7064955.1 uracil phosphoribosyltransferase [Verrucomicrobiota bacterium]MBT7702062.1 uracil phosphoribosyltransferase [Verrucomicrobiota bacterium]